MSLYISTTKVLETDVLCTVSRSTVRTWAIKFRHNANAPQSAILYQLGHLRLSVDVRIWMVGTLQHANCEQISGLIMRNHSVIPFYSNDIATACYQLGQWIAVALIWKRLVIDNVPVKDVHLVVGHGVLRTPITTAVKQLVLFT